MAILTQTHTSPTAGAKLLSLMKHTVLRGLNLMSE